MFLRFSLVVVRLVCQGVLVLQLLDQLHETIQTDVGLIVDLSLWVTKCIIYAECVLVKHHDIIYGIHTCKANWLCISVFALEHPGQGI